MSQSSCLSVGAGILWWGRRKVTPPEQHVSLAEGCQSAGFPLLPDLTPLSVKSPAVGAEEASTQVSIFFYLLHVGVLTWFKKTTTTQTRFYHSLI